MGKATRTTWGFSFWLNCIVCPARSLKFEPGVAPDELVEEFEHGMASDPWFWQKALRPKRAQES